MDLIYIGKLVNTHGIKGEVRILSNFRHIDKVFIKDMKFYVQKILHHNLKIQSA